MDLTELLRSLRVEGYDSNVPNAPPRQPRDLNTATKEDVEAHLARRREELQRRYEEESGALGTMGGGAAPVDSTGYGWGDIGRGALEMGGRALDTAVDVGSRPVRALERKVMTHGQPRPAPRAAQADVRNIDNRIAATPQPMAGAPAPRGALEPKMIPGARPADFPRESPEQGRAAAVSALALMRNELEAAKAEGNAELVATLEAEIKRVSALAGAPVAQSAPAALRGPQGALSVGTEPFEMGAAESANQNAALETAQGALEPVRTGPPPAPRQSYPELLKQRLAEMEQQTGQPLTEQQKSEAQLDFFLRLLGNNKPGSRFLQNAGQAGLGTSAVLRDLRERNRRDAAERRREAREDAFREVTLLDKDEDNRRADRGLDITERLGKERMDLLRRQLEQGKWKVLDNAEGGTYMLVDQESGQTRDTGIKLLRDDKRPAQVQLIQYLEGLPSDRRARALMWLGKEKEPDDTKLVVELAGKAIDSARVSGRELSMDQAVREARQAAAAARGNAPPADQPTKPATEADAHRQAKAAVARGVSREAVNQRLRAWGYKPI